MNPDTLRAGPARRRTSPRFEMLGRLLDPEIKPKPDAKQAARREALRSAVRRIRRRYGDIAIRWASEIAESSP